MSHRAPASKFKVPAFKVAVLVLSTLEGLVRRMLRPLKLLRRRVQAVLVDTSLSPVLGRPARQAPAGNGMGAEHAAPPAIRQHAEIQVLLERIEAVLDHADVGIALTRNGCFELVSRQFCHIFRCDKASIVGQATRSIHSSDEAYQALSERARPAFMAKGAFDGELELRRTDGALFWAHMRGRAVVPGDRSKGTIWIIEDVTEAHAQRERLVWTANHDALTGLMNRRAFEATLGEATARSAHQPFCALFIDLDRFKQVNDSAGHAAGDAVLRDVAQLLVTQVRKSDTVARLGGDEFAVLLSCCPLAQAEMIAEKMRAAVADYRMSWEGGLALSVGTSIGLLPVDGRYGGAAEVLQAADAACYAAKRQGRNCVVVVDADAPVPAAGANAAPVLTVAAVAAVAAAVKQLESLSA